ncbi:hypothetical protein Forpe1208_v007039 [Fusarium oxysporum f. sp. rapae]|uniref:Uncharacterized protein n=1 Tax=Fusarium oxysporum f. sp. rapae TaxID=485398 RepID=A0A8J5P532_FUSOX|nr:hypothetical protein Forpe1208_v007039 [Fusarium oxysporum f. sp. rapae]
MERRPHDRNLSESLQPLIELDEHVLVQKMEQALHAVSELKAQGKRVLIYVRENLTATTLNEKMRASGLNSHEVATIWTKAECGRIIYNFNDAKHPTDAVITTFATLKTLGPKFYGACHRGIILEIADDLEDFVLATRALNSIGQTQAVEWTTYYVRDTVDMVRDLAMAQKAVSAITRNPAMYPDIKGDLRGILAFYEVALRMGNVVSRYPRNRVHWSYMETEEIKREGKFESQSNMKLDLTFIGLFYFAVAKFLEENPAAASKFKKGTMARIAKSWKPEQDLTMNHVNLKLPAIEDGVVLYNYVKDGYKQQL